jgi:hypothetical protein
MRAACSGQAREAQGRRGEAVQWWRGGQAVQWWRVARGGSIVGYVCGARNTLSKCEGILATKCARNVGSMCEDTV